MTSVSLNQVQKLKYCITWLENYRQKQEAAKNDLQNLFVATRVRLDNLNLEENWGPLWKAWKPTRQINHMLDSLLFYKEADRFLLSKRTEMELALKILLDPAATDPIELAQHQVRHRQILEQLEKEGASDCEELLANIEQGTAMLQFDDDDFEVKPSQNLFCFYGNTIQLEMGRDLTRPYRPTVRSTYNSGRTTPKFRSREPKKPKELGRKRDDTGVISKKPKKKVNKKISVK